MKGKKKSTEGRAAAIHCQHLLHMCGSVQSGRRCLYANLRKSFVFIYIHVLVTPGVDMRQTACFVRARYFTRLDPLQHLVTWRLGDLPLSWQAISSAAQV